MKIDEQHLRFDALLPPQMAQRAVEIGVSKSKLNKTSTFALAVLAGAFVALGAIFYTVVVTGNFEWYGLSKTLGGVAFSLGLILVVVAGAELFTGNNLIIMALVSKKLKLSELLINWCIVYTGNFIGALATAALMFVAAQYAEPSESGSIGINALKIASAKCSLSWLNAFTRGILCNALVCLAIWLCFSARSTTDKILSIIFPISAFVACGFEHSIANMYFIPIGLLIKTNWAFTSQYLTQIHHLDHLNITNFLFANLVPVTLGNIVGGSFMVGLVYWWIYSRPKKS